MTMPNASPFPSLIQLARSALILLPLIHGTVRAQSALPEGTLGWWYFSGINSETRYASDPITACKNGAWHHAREPLVAMRPFKGRRDMFECAYRWLPVHGPVSWLGDATLSCKPGYSSYPQGVCRKNRPERPAPLKCGEAAGNPVQFASGSKIQHETDMGEGGNDLLRVRRTYRSVRENGLGQSAGMGWSFSFERAFFAPRSLFGGIRPRIIGALSDGTFFEFSRQGSGPYKSTLDRGMTLEVRGPDETVWLLTTPDGTVERFLRDGDDFRLTSVHTRTGMALHYTYDTEKHLSKIVDSSGRSLTMKWEDGVITSISNATGSVRYEYEHAVIPGDGPIAGMDRLIGVRHLDRSGTELSSRAYHYEDPNDRFLLTGITDEHDKRFATYAYDVNGQAVLSEHAGGAQRYTFAYPSRTSRIVTDPLGSSRNIAIAYDFNNKSQITAESQPAGAGCAASAKASTYTENGDVESRTDFNGNKTCFISDPIRGTELARMTGLAKDAACPASIDSAMPAGARKTSTRWHPDWPLAISVAAPGRTDTKFYNGQRDASGKVVECAGGAVLPNGKPIAVVCRASVQATSDTNGGLGFAAVGTGPVQEWRYTYNGTGQMLTSSGPADANGKTETTSMTYYADTTASHAPGDLASVRNSVGEVTIYLEYSEDGLPTKIQRPNGQMVGLEYGARQRLVSSTVRTISGQAETMRYEYDIAGQLIRTTAPDGSALEYTYDDAHRMTGLRDRAGNSINFTLDAMGNVVRQEMKDPNGKLVAQTTRAFDALSRLQREQRSATDPGARFEYDAVGNLTSSTDSMGRVSKGTYDTFNRLIQQALPAADAMGKPATIDYAYTPQDQLASVLDPRRLQTRYVFNGLGQQTTLISPDTGTTSTQFDGAGNVISNVDAAGRKTAYRYDAAGRVTGIGTSTFEYGAAGTPAAGRITAMTDEAGKTVYVYDSMGRLLRKEQTNGAASRRFVTAYTYGSEGSAIGHATSMTYPSGNRIDVTYDGNGKPSSLGLTRPNAARTTILSDITYQPFGAARSWLWGNHNAGSPNKYERQFDIENRQVSYPLGNAAAGGALRTLSYDDAGRIVSSTHKGGTPGKLDQRYYYDGRDRLVGFDSAMGGQSFEYDANGNRTRLKIGPNSYLNTIDPGSNRLTSTSGPVPAKRNTYDATGNLISDGTIRYVYGNNGRLSSTTGINGASTQNRYNGLGQRAIKSDVAGASTYFVYNEAGQMVGEYNSAGTPIQETIYLEGMPVAVIKPRASAAEENAYYVYADHLATPRVITRASDNKMVWRWDGANPFGEDQPDENPNRVGNFAYNLRFPGQYYDRETNLHYNYFRDYDPQTGRYVQSDPMGLQGGINTYGYVEANPLRKTDPSGLQSVPGEPSLTPSRPYVPGPFDPVIPGTPAHDVWKRFAEKIIEWCTSSAEPAARESSRERQCKADWEKEYAACDKYWDLGGDAVRACRARANDRLTVCMKNQPGGPPVWTPGEMPGR
ncbi:RHS repeat protein [Massilia violaceinigra]|uniref:RHS repeat protein n=1 Tax=Massilia violaceinigra TaxID=2045208 RepID=A0ABY3ZZ44_9BURK|nr:RHS repeat-associated core domain-containing protein [Massilia violaceinigra]UOD27739.1 RHS repeat protein [Massilia violaceinigra]